MTSLCPGHGLDSRDLDFLSFLHQGTQGAAADQQQIVEGRARDATLLADFPSDFDGCHEVDDRHEVGNTASTARLTDGLRVLAESVARDEVGDNTQAKVVEATEESMLPVTRHFVSSFTLSFEVEGQEDIVLS